ncbi:hypothetical protein HUJ05_003371 [Dendroctonus ponderosae]|nr:hypothetical protein HUJ05_003371 [Dendroctonus ponderosae]KAH1023770.1 hypothetical protein HUJ05_003371 [Dendroctonus ponderosae]
MFKMIWTTSALFPMLCFIVQSVPIPNNLLVTVPNGAIQGAAYSTGNNISYFGFRGIPFATPPIDDLRFEPPQPAQPWTGILDATQDASGCISIFYGDSTVVESEDCLYLNVYVPNVQLAEDFPVMFFIFGGGFREGNSSKLFYGPDFLMERGNVILVTFNYRLGAFGFISTEDEVLPGNAGLKDQNLALQWTYENIIYFGGDPNKITIFGESAGGASTGLHLVSKKSAGKEHEFDNNCTNGWYRGYFSHDPYRPAGKGKNRDNQPRQGAQKNGWDQDNDDIAREMGTVQRLVQNIHPERLFRAAIVQSGSAVNSWSILRDSKTLTYKLVNGIPGGNIVNTSQELKTFLKSRNVTEIMASENANEILFGPVLEPPNENSFLSEYPYQLLDTGDFNQVPIIIGICAEESLLFLKDLQTTALAAKNADLYPALLIPSDLLPNSTDEDIVAEEIKNIYLTDNQTFSSNLTAYAEYLSDAGFAVGILKHAQLTSNYMPVHLYRFAYYGRPVAIPFLEGNVFFYII